MAIASGGADLLSEIPGIGKKTANRIILELKEKVAAGWLTAPPPEFAEENTEVLAALTSLGYSVREASHAVTTLPTDQKLTLEEKIRLALGYFTAK